MIAISLHNLFGDRALWMRGRIDKFEPEYSGLRTLLTGCALQPRPRESPHIVSQLTWQGKEEIGQKNAGHTDRDTRCLTQFAVPSHVP